MDAIIKVLTGLIKAVTLTLGYPGVVLLMCIESACIPLPSEIIMPLAGALCSKEGAELILGPGAQPWNLHIAAFCGALGCMLGSIIAYWAGKYGGRPFFEKYGKYVLIRKKDLDKADVWFGKWGTWATFFSRMLPVIRTFISLPAGIAKMHFWKFTLLAFLGSWPWCYLLVYFGQKLGDNWQQLREKAHGLDYIILGGLAILFVVWLWHHLQPEKENKESSSDEDEQDKETISS